MRRTYYIHPHVWIAFVLLSALASAVVKLQISKNTHGQDDVLIWFYFLSAIDEAGPVRVYSEMDMNHPPGAAWLLFLVGLFREELPFPFLLRLPTVVADFVTTVIAFDLLRRRVSFGIAAASAACIAASPVLIVQAGFHGNWDIVVLAFVVCAIHAMATKRNAFLAGFLVALGVSVKIIGVVVIPTFIAWGILRGSRDVRKVILGGSVVFCLLWMPVLIVSPRAFLENVLGYSGANTPRTWGFPALLELLGAPEVVESLLVSPGRFLLLLLSAGVPAALVLKERLDAVQGVALSLLLLLFTLVAWGPQYLAWPVVLAYFIGPGVATIYQLVAGSLTLVLYSNWADAPVGQWYEAGWEPLAGVEWPLMFGAWLAVGAAALRVRIVMRGPGARGDAWNRHGGRCPARPGAVRAKNESLRGSG